MGFRPGPTHTTEDGLKYPFKKIEDDQLRGNIFKKQV